MHMHDMGVFTLSVYVNAHPVNYISPSHHLFLDILTLCQNALDTISQDDCGPLNIHAVK